MLNFPILACPSFFSLFHTRPGRQIPSEMANEGERSTAADKGKGKVDDVRELNGKKSQKDEKTSAEGKKKDEEPQEGMS